MATKDKDSTGGFDGEVVACALALMRQVAAAQAAECAEHEAGRPAYEGKLLLTVPEVADWGRCREDAVRHAVNVGELPAVVRTGRNGQQRLYVERDEARRWLTRDPFVSPWKVVA